MPGSPTTPAVLPKRSKPGTAIGLPLLDRPTAHGFQQGSSWDGRVECCGMPGVTQWLGATLRARPVTSASQGNTKKHKTDDKNPGFHRSRLRFMIPFPLLLLFGQLIVCGLDHENALSLVRLRGSRSRTTIAGQERSGRCGLPGCRSQFMLCGTLADNLAASVDVPARGTQCGVEPRQIAANPQSPALEAVDEQNPAVCSRQKVEVRWRWWGPARNRLEACQIGQHRTRVSGSCNAGRAVQSAAVPCTQSTVAPGNSQNSRCHAVPVPVTARLVWPFRMVGLDQHLLLRARPAMLN